MGPGHPRAARGGLGLEVNITGITTAYAGGGGSGSYFNPHNTVRDPNGPENGGGGGSGGLGSAVAQSLVKDYKIIIGYNNNKKKAKNISDSFNKKGFDTKISQVDVCNINSIKKFLKLSDEGKKNNLVGVVNAVGPAIPLKPLAEVSEDEFKSILSIDVFGSFNVLKESFSVLSQKGGGSIVQFLTTAVLRTLENDGMSGIPKTAIMAIVRQLAREVKDTNVRINAVAPGCLLYTSPSPRD